MLENKNINYFGQYFRLALIFIIFLEIISYLGFIFPEVNELVFLVIIIFTLILSIVKLEYGLYIVLAELFIGSKGYLFSLNIESVELSIRIALFLILIAVWLFKVLKNKKIEIRQSNLFWPLVLLAIIVVFGLINGLIRGNEFDNLFFDINGWLYFGLVLVLFSVIKSWSKIENIIQILLAGVGALALKTVVLLFFFSHNIEVVIPSVYRWVRVTGVGEITLHSGNFYRIFIQSQLYSLVALFILLSILLFIKRKNWGRSEFWLAFFILLTSLPVLISFSRSFWIGVLAGFMVLFSILIFKRRYKLKKLSLITGILVVILVLEVGIIGAIINFPLPHSNLEGVSAASLIEKRSREVSGEIGASSRYNLLPPLWQKIRERPLFGSGYGTTVSYKTEDPRALVSSPDGLYTTFAFEWGYLDIWVKIGLVGLLIYFWLIIRIVRNGWNVYNNQEDKRIRGLSLGLISGLAAILAVNFFSPYLNHPLGIGYLILTGSIFEILTKNQ